MKMAYERPVMRAELFNANGYVALCQDVPGSSNPVSYIIAELAGIGRWLFSAVPHYNRNDGTGDDQWYYTEYKGALSDAHKNDADFMSSLMNDKPGVNADIGYTQGTGTYFLEWSEPEKEYFIYEDEKDSGYDPNGYIGGENVTVSGVGTLQVNGSADNGGWSNLYRNLFNGRYNADRSVWQGENATMSFYDGTETTPAIPMLISN